MNTLFGDPHGEEDTAIRGILTRTRRIALVGASDRAHRPSHQVLQILLEHGYDVTPVNPGLAGEYIHGKLVVATLAEAAPLDMVDLFRAASSLEPDVDEAIRLGANTVWMQIGVVNERAAIKARNAGVQVIMNRCPSIEIPRLRVPKSA